MKMRTKIGIFLMMLTICASAFAGPEQHSIRATNASASKAKPPSPTLIFNRKLASTSISLGEDVVDLNSGKQAIDSPLNFVCPNGGCTITAEIHVQMGFNTSSGNPLALCADLDGSDMPPIGCPNVLTLPTDNSFVSGSFAFAQSGVKAGNHAIQSFVVTTFGATRANYEITYRLYTP